MPTLDSERYRWDSDSLPKMKPYKTQATRVERMWNSSLLDFQLCQSIFLLNRSFGKFKSTSFMRGLNSEKILSRMFFGTNRASSGMPKF